MAGLQRSATSFRRQGSSGLVWDDRFLSGELVKLSNKEEGQREEQQQQERDDQDHEKAHRMKGTTKKTLRPISTMERYRSSEGGRGFRTGKLSPGNDEPPSPKLSACGFWGIFGKKGDKAGPKKTGGKRRRR